MEYYSVQLILNHLKKKNMTNMAGTLYQSKSILFSDMKCNHMQHNGDRNGLH